MASARALSSWLFLSRHDHRSWLSDDEAMALAVEETHSARKGMNPPVIVDTNVVVAGLITSNKTSPAALILNVHVVGEITLSVVTGAA